MDDTAVSASRLPTGHLVVDHGRIGVLIVNLGTPDTADAKGIRVYLREFLSDPRVIETNRALWWVILNGAILTFRPWRSGHAYARIWNDAAGESPLKELSTDPLSVELDERQNRIAEIFDKYNLLALPVIDEAQRLTGVISVDDIVNVLRRR